MFHEIGATAKKACNLKPAKCGSLADGTRSVPSLPKLILQADVIREGGCSDGQLAQIAGSHAMKTLTFKTSTLNWCWQFNKLATNKSLQSRGVTCIAIEAHITALPAIFCTI